MWQRGHECALLWYGSACWHSGGRAGPLKGMLPSRAVHAPTHPTPSQPAPHSPVPPRQIHVKNLKPSPAANPLVNRCIECGFCESNCPSRCVGAGLCCWLQVLRAGGGVALAPAATAGARSSCRATLLLLAITLARIHHLHSLPSTPPTAGTSRSPPASASRCTRSCSGCGRWRTAHPSSRWGCRGGFSLPLVGSRRACRGSAIVRPGASAQGNAITAWKPICAPLAPCRRGWTRWPPSLSMTARTPARLVRGRGSACSAGHAKAAGLQEAGLRN